jgi:hypothetical protein
MAKRTKSRGQVRTKRSKPSKPRAQISANRCSDRTKPAKNPDVNAPSLSVLDAANWAGVSRSTVKRMCKDGTLGWFRTRGPHGHIRVLSESLEKLRKGGEAPSVAASPGLVRGKRENVEVLRAEIEERKLKRELRHLDEEDSETERRRAAAAQAEELDRTRAVEEVRLQAARQAAERQDREREREEAEERREWTDRWVAWALNAVPKDAPREIELDVAQAAEETLSELSPEQPQNTIHRLVVAAIEKSLRPWRRQKQIEEIVQLARKELPFFAQNYFEPTMWEMKAVETARNAVRCLLSDASPEQLRQASIQAGRQVAAEYEAGEARAHALAQVERERQQRESNKKALITVGVGHVYWYLEKLRSDGGHWDEDLDRRGDLESLVRKALEDRLTGKEGIEDAWRVAREVVDAELAEESV